MLEAELTDVETLSVGFIDIVDEQIGYCGRQRLTANNEGVMVYGGSDLTAVRGRFDALTQLPLDASLQLAIEASEWERMSAAIGRVMKLA